MRHLTVNPSGCYDAASTIYEWYYTTGSPGGAHHSLGTTTVPTLTYTLSTSANNYVYCIMHTTCPNKTTGAADPYINTVITNSITFTWQTAMGC
ncbi:MAG: hypothetical protein WDN75_21345 [Bacteroidota bacterium]